MEIEFFPIEAVNNAIKRNYVEGIVDKVQPNSKCWLRRDKDKAICHKRMQQFRARELLDKARWVGEGDHTGIVQDIWPYYQMQKPMRHITFTVILWYKLIYSSQQEDQILWLLAKKIEPNE